MVKFSKDLVKKYIFQALKQRDPNIKAKITKKDISNIVREEVSSYYEGKK